MKRLAVLLAAIPLLGAPAGAAAADFVLRNLSIDIGIHDRHAGGRHPEVVVIRDDDDRRGRHHHRDRREWRHGHRRQEPRVIVIDRRSHHCDTPRVLAGRPGTVVVVADGRRR